MKKSMILLADGYEEVEALTVVDVFRRAGQVMDMVSITGRLETVGDHMIGIKADYLLEDISGEDYGLLVLPGGMPGSKALTSHPQVQQLIKDFAARDKWLGAICAAPMALGRAGLLSEASGTAYPGIVDDQYAEYLDQLVVVSDRLITGQGPAAALPFALELLVAVAGEDLAEEVSRAMLVPRLIDYCQDLN